MQVHEIQPTHKKSTRRRIGRGGKKGTYSGRGMKGQKSRAGARFQPRVREILKKYPKLRGYRARRAPSNLVSVNVDTLEKHFQKGDSVTPEVLVKTGIVGTIKGRVPAVKILGRGKLSKTLLIEGCTVSKSAKEKIEAAGGSQK
jgi:large subunit ribosomal protein L15